MKEGVRNLADCIFCQIIQRLIPADVVYEDESVLAFNDIRPMAPVHILIIPKRHIPSLTGMDSDEGAGLIGRLHRAAVAVAHKAGVDGSGYRLVVNCGRDAGQDVDHVHYHLLGGRVLQWPPG